MQSRKILQENVSKMYITEAISKFVIQYSIYLINRKKVEEMDQYHANLTPKEQKTLIGLVGKLLSNYV